MQLVSLIQSLQQSHDDIKKELSNLYKSGESVQDIVAVVKFLESQKVSIPAPQNVAVFDVCGTGGTKKQRINLSTALAIKLSQEFCIAKHGNKSSSGRCGSFDILVDSGFPMCIDPSQVSEQLRDKNCAFVFGPAFHPVMGLVAPMRKALAHSTIFNFVGPLLNPVKNLTAQMIGVKDIETGEKLAQVCADLGKDALLVHDTVFGLDEVSIGGATQYFKVLNGNIEKGQFVPEDFGVQRISDFSEIKGGENIEQNQKIFYDLLDGKASSAQQAFLEVNYRVAKDFFSQF